MDASPVLVHHRGMAGEVLGLVGTEKHGMGKLVRVLENAVRRSFEEDKSRRTQDEAKRRTRICVAVIRELRNDMKWSIDRIASELPVALRAKLDGIPWDPSTAARRSMFLADSPTVLTPEHLRPRMTGRAR